MLLELAALGMQVARSVARLVAIEEEVAATVASWLPAGSPVPVSLAQATEAGLAVDGADAALASGVPRVVQLAGAFDRVSRSVRRTLALAKRIEAGWPARGAADDRAAMVRRQIAEGVAKAIRRAAEGDAAERLFDDLADRLDDPALAHDLDTLPVDVIVGRICRELGLAAGAVRDLGGELVAGAGVVRDSG